jgi:hypothetical protein
MTSEKKAASFVAAGIEIAPIGHGFIPQNTEALPRQEVRRDGDGDTRLVRDERRVRHEVTLEPRHVYDAWIFHPAAARADFVRFVRFECDSETLDTHRRRALETHACVSDPRIVPFSDEAGKEMHRTIRRTNAAGIEDPPGFVRLTRFRTHDHAEPRRGKIKTGCY